MWLSITIGDNRVFIKHKGVCSIMFNFDNLNYKSRINKGVYLFIFCYI